MSRYLQMVVEMVEALGREATYGRYLDLIQEGNIALEQAVCTFSPVLGRDGFEKHARERGRRTLQLAGPQPHEPRVTSPSSDLREATVDGDLAGGHEAAVLRREKGSHRPELRRIGHALERIHRGERLHALVA